MFISDVTFMIHTAKAKEIEVIAIVNVVANSAACYDAASMASCE